MADCSIDAIVTDPPYGLSFMGKKWDYDVPSVEIWQEALRVLKPGGHLLAFAGTRTQHRMACNIEDAGFETRDLIMWHYGSGFPKSRDISKDIDRIYGAERTVISEIKTNSGGMAHISKTNAEHGFRPTAYNGHSLDDSAKNCIQVTAPATSEASQWEGWGTALKPATEIITMARKPFKGTVAANVLAHGTGAINVDGCRVEVSQEDQAQMLKMSEGFVGKDMGRPELMNYGYIDSMPKKTLSIPKPNGRWPANIVHDGSDEVVELFPQSGKGSGAPTITTRQRDKGWFNSSPGQGVSAIDNFGDSGSAARFFYCAKTSKKERGEGNNHPTVKPIALMRYLCRLVTPSGGTVLDPFMGSGSTGIAALEEGFDFIGIEQDADYLAIAQGRIDNFVKTIPE